MKNLDFTGRVAVVTGAGRGIGREYALLLASRGASVVVNDIGADVLGGGVDASIAQLVVDEIRDAGGRATSSTSDISTRDGGETLVFQAMEEFGHIDILMHNAGSLRQAPFAELDWDSIQSVVATHLFGAFHVGQASWRAMESRGYGRILLTTSVALFGAPDLSIYASVKAACVSLAKSLALEAERSHLDIKVNAISPTASTRRSSYSHQGNREAARVDAAFGERMDPKNVAAVAIPLVSEECPVTGECIKAGCGAASRIFFGLTNGWSGDNTYLTPEEILVHFPEIMSLDDFEIPTSSANARELTLAGIDQATSESG